MTALVLNSIRREYGRGSLPAARKALGWGIALLGLAGLMVNAVDGAAAMLAQERVHAALTGGTIAALATAAGAVPALMMRQVSRKLQDALLGSGAGVMLAATAFSLVIPALDAAQAQGAGKWSAAGLVAAGMLFGTLCLLGLDHILGDLAPSGGRDAVTRTQRVWLFVAAVTLHNLPEGLAIGVGYGGTDAASATALAAGIAIQDMPEGLVVALALLGVGYSRTAAAVLGAATGLVEPIGAAFGAGLVGWSATMLPWGLAFAAGAMLCVIGHEIIPESHRHGHATQATSGLVGGFVVMMLLDTALG